MASLQIGTYQAAVLAARHNIPFMVVAPVATVDLPLSTGAECVSSGCTLLEADEK
jgi:methylthioribose-1-phosphate isomerase